MKRQFILKNKRAVALRLEKSKLFAVFVFLNLVVFHWEERKHWCCRRKQNKSTVYVIRPRGKHEGLMSSYFYVAKEVSWALSRNYIPYVDFESENCQFHVGREVNHTRNAWEYFFSQPFSGDIRGLMTSSNILLGGWTYNKKLSVPPISREVSAVSNGKTRQLCREYLHVQQYVLDRAAMLSDRIFPAGEKVVGVFLRGTDYVALEPPGHPRQPQVEQVVEKIDEFRRKYHIKYIYLVTEDYGYYQKFKNIYGANVFCADDKFVEKYGSTDYVSAVMEDDPYAYNLRYILRLIMLTYCDYLIASKANGSYFSRVIKSGDYIEEYWFELGDY